MTDAPRTLAIRALREAALEFSRNPEKALQMLSEAMERAETSGDGGAIALLAKPAGVLCEGMGNLEAALAFYERAIAAQPEDAWLWIACAQLHKRLCHGRRALVAFARALELGELQGDEDAAEIARNA